MRVPIAIANFGGQGAEQLEREQHVAMVSIARRDGSTLRSRRVSHSRRQLEMPRIASSQTGRIENVRLGRRFSCEPGFEQDVSPGELTITSARAQGDLTAQERGDHEHGRTW